ncbi:MAG: CDP-Glycerol:Poly(glycerophosphate) glycerophosphotransferase [Pseudomonadota bacterium]|jgi:hypothetical protein
MRNIFRPLLDALARPRGAAAASPPKARPAPAAPGIEADPMVAIRRAFSSASRASDHAAAVAVLRDILKGDPAAGDGGELADFAYRGIRAVSAHVPPAQHHDLLLTFAYRFPDAGERPATAVNIVLREAGREHVAGFFQPYLDGALGPDIRQRLEWVAEALVPTARDWSSAVRTAIRAQDFDGLATVLTNALALECHPAESDEEWGALLLPGLNCVVPAGPIAEMTHLSIEFASRFRRIPHLATAAMALLLRRASPDIVLGQFGHEDRATFASDLLRTTMRQEAGLPSDTAAPRFSRQTPDQRVGLARSAAISLGNRGDALPDETILFVAGDTSDAAVDLLAQAFVDREAAGRARVLFENSDEMTRHRERLIHQAGFTAGDFAVLPPIDLRLDNALFAAAETMVDAVFANLPAGPGKDALVRVEPDLRGDLVDRLVNVLRKQEMLRLDDGALSRRIVLCPLREGDVCLAHDLAGLCTMTEIVMAVWPWPEHRRLRLADPWQADAGPRFARTAQVLDPHAAATALETAKGRSEIFLINLSDRQYLQTFVALAEHADTPVCVISPTALPANPAGTATTALPANVIAVQLSQTIAPADQTGLPEAIDLDAIADTLEQALLTLATDNRTSDGALGRSALRQLGRILMPRTSLALSYDAFFSALAGHPGMKVLTVSPGRTMPARIAVRRAQEAGVRTVDLQAGAVSRLRRFRAPIAEIATCIDRPHWDIYRNHFGLADARIAVTGSPRIDALLKPLRDADRNTVRDSLGIDASVRVLFLATQPIEIDRMTAIAKIAMTATDDGWHVVLKPHPGERDHQIAAYEALRRSTGRPDLIRIDRELDVYKLMVASDVVATYFSTVGQEAFALGRKVVVIDPFDVPPDLDYVAMGLATRVRDPSELAGALQEDRGAVGLSTDPYLAVLQDGQAATRVWETIHANLRPTAT